MNAYIKNISTTPENILPPKKRDISFRIFGLLLSNTHDRLVTYAKSTEINHAIPFETR
jgi:hypothetical protein